MPHKGMISRRDVILAGTAALVAPRMAFAQADDAIPDTDATFLFTSDTHACRMADGLSPNCAEQGKTDENLLRHIAALNGLRAQFDGRRPSPARPRLWPAPAASSAARSAWFSAAI